MTGFPHLSPLFPTFPPLVGKHRAPFPTPPVIGVGGGVGVRITRRKLDANSPLIPTQEQNQ